MYLHNIVKVLEWQEETDFTEITTTEHIQDHTLLMDTSGEKGNPHIPSINPNLLSTIINLMPMAMVKKADIMRLVL